MRLPSVFISHGAPNLVLHNSQARDFLGGFGTKIGTPRAIVIASAHFAASRPTVVGDEHPGMIYDFSGFEPELNQMVYPAPGDALVAAKVAGLMQAAGLAPAVAPKRGYDHGTWVPLMLMYPKADVPVVQVSVQPQLGAGHHFAIGRALASLADENILVIGSGSATHNLAEFFRGGYPEDAPAPEWVTQFDEWVRQKVEAGAVEDLVDYRARAPFARENHPTEEHFLPLHVSLGAAGAAPKGTRVHTSHQGGVLMMDAYTFG